ncbi:unnamed protein product [Prunus armeniaca]
MRDTGVPDRHGEAAVKSSSRPIVTTVQQGNSRVPMGLEQDYRERVGQLPPGLCLKALCEGHQDFLEVMEESTVKLKQPIPTEDIKKVDWMMTKVPATV